MAAVLGKANVGATPKRRGGLQRFARRKSTIAFLMALPLILLIGSLVVYPTLYAIYLAMLNKSLERFVGLSNFTFLFTRETFWMVVKQSCIFAVSAVVFKALIGFAVAHFVHNVPAKGQRKWRGMLLIPWVIPPAMSTLGWFWLFDPSYSAFNWVFVRIGLPSITWLGDANWARFSVILVNVWYGAPFFLIMYLAALKSVPDQLYEAASIDGASWWQELRYITLPLMAPAILVTFAFRLVIAFKVFDEIYLLTGGGPVTATEVLSFTLFQRLFTEDREGYGSAMAVAIIFLCSLLLVVAVSVGRRSERAA